jgi:hypothetical protein
MGPSVRESEFWLLMGSGWAALTPLGLDIPTVNQVFLEDLKC